MMRTLNVTATISDAQGRLQKIGGTYNHPVVHNKIQVVCDAVRNKTVCEYLGIDYAGGL